MQGKGLKPTKSSVGRRRTNRKKVEVEQGQKRHAMIRPYGRSKRDGAGDSNSTRQGRRKSLRLGMSRFSNSLLPKKGSGPSFINTIGPYIMKSVFYGRKRKDKGSLEIRYWPLSGYRKGN